MRLILHSLSLLFWCAMHNPIVLTDWRVCRGSRRVHWKTTSNRCHFFYVSLSLSLDLFRLLFCGLCNVYTSDRLLYPISCSPAVYRPVHIILTVWQCTQALFRLSPGTLTHSFTLNPFPYYLIWIPLSPYACAHTYTHIHIYIYTYRSKEGRL